jgi:hypothetical protein
MRSLARPAELGLTGKSLTFKTTKVLKIGLKIAAGIFG